MMRDTDDDDREPWVSMRRVLEERIAEHKRERARAMREVVNRPRQRAEDGDR